MHSPVEHLQGLAGQVAGWNPVRRTGTLLSGGGPVLLACLPGAALGEKVWVGSQRLPAEVVGFREGNVQLLPAGPVEGLYRGTIVMGTGTRFSVRWTPELKGKVIDTQGRCLRGGSISGPTTARSLECPAPDPILRQPIQKALPTGVRAIDGLLTLGQGQRVGLFAPPGVGKSTLLGQIARGTAADTVVVCLVGERGREVNEFLDGCLGFDGLRRAVVVCATSDAPAGERARALPMATAVAEGFREQGQSVLLLVDSLTRHARALREIAISLGEPPARRGYPSSVFERLAGVVERAGNSGAGSITAIYTVLTDGEVEEDPLAEEVRSLLDGHYVLDRRLAREGCFPALHPAASLSRLMDDLVGKEHGRLALEFKKLFDTYENRRELIELGAYEMGSDPLVDRAMALRPAQLRFLSQGKGEHSDWSSTCQALSQLCTAGSIP